MQTAPLAKLHLYLIQYNVVSMESTSGIVTQQYTLR